MVLFICNMTGKIECQGDIKAFNSKEKSEKSSKPCDIRQDNIRKSRLKTTVQLPAQSAMKGNYTPWIAYRADELNINYVAVRVTSVLTKNITLREDH